MPKRNSDNLRIKRKYLVWMKDARGYSEAYIDKAAAAISTKANAVAVVISESSGKVTIFAGGSPVLELEGRP